MTKDLPVSRECFGEQRGSRGETEPVGRARGGYARAAALSPERRSEICRNASNVRWARGWLSKTPPGGSQ